MIAELVPFNYGDTAVRVVIVNSEPWFVLADLCKVLGLSNPTMVADRIDCDALSRTEVIDSMGRTQSAVVVSEAGMYEVVIRSDKPEAVTFRRWLTGKVLPTIRKTGGYGKPVIDGNSITRLELIEIARNAETERLALEAENRELGMAATS